MLEFNGKWIANTHGPIVVGSPEVQRRTAKFWGLVGEGEIVDEPGGRNLFATIILHDGYTKFAAFEKALAKLEELVGKHGTLKETGDLKREFKNVTFTAFEPLLLQGQDEPGPLLDVGVLTRTPDSETIDGGWFQMFWLQFRQLRT